MISHPSVRLFVVSYKDHHFKISVNVSVRLVTKAKGNLANGWKSGKWANVGPIVIVILINFQMTPFLTSLSFSIVL